MSDCKLRCRCCRLRCCRRCCCEMSSSTILWRFRAVHSHFASFFSFGTIRQYPLLFTQHWFTILIQDSVTLIANFGILYIEKHFAFNEWRCNNYTNSNAFKNISFDDKTENPNANTETLWQRFSIVKITSSKATKKQTEQNYRLLKCFKISNHLNTLRMDFEYWTCQREGEKEKKKQTKSFDILLFHALIVSGIMFSRRLLLFTFSYRRWREWRDRHTANTCKYSDLPAIYLQAQHGKFL